LSIGGFATFFQRKNKSPPFRAGYGLNWKRLQRASMTGPACLRGAHGRHLPHHLLPTNKLRAVRHILLLGVLRSSAMQSSQNAGYFMETRAPGRLVSLTMLACFEQTTAYLSPPTSMPCSAAL
jgi:hypothetical protein